MKLHECKGCGRQFLPKRKEQKFCSSSCAAKDYHKEKNVSGSNNPNWKGGNINKICEECGNSFTVGYSRREKARFCSLICANNYQSLHPYTIGKRNPKPIIMCELCGNQIQVDADRQKRRRFCSYECFRKWADNEYKSSKTKTREYSIWVGIKDRCGNPHNKSYQNYGGRGISICAEWENSFEQFFCDMGPCPENFTIERINNELGYFKENCCWIPQSEQSKNRRNVSRVNFMGEMFLIREFAEILEQNESTVRKKLKKNISPHEIARESGYFNK